MTTSVTHADTPDTKRRRRKAAVIIGVATLAVGGAIAGVGAIFTDQATVADQTVNTATISVEADTAATSSPIAVANMLPGESASTIITIANTGTRSAHLGVTLTPTETADAALIGALNVTLTDSASGTVTRTLAQFEDGSWHIASPLAAGGSTDVTIAVDLPIDADNAMQAKSAGFSVTVDAQQAEFTAGTAYEWTSGWVAN